MVRILAGPQRDEHVIFSSLRAHYLFESYFCRPAQAHEKGAVENLVGYARRNTLVPVPDFPSWEALEAHLLAWCEAERRRLGDTWQKEREVLQPLPRFPFRCAVTKLVSVNRLCLVHFDRNRYSVPCEHVGKTLQLFAYADRVEIADGKKVVAVHERFYGRGETSFKLEHYLPALARKPRAATHLALVPKMPPVYARVRQHLLRARQDGYHEFAAILLLHQDFPAEAVTRALEEAADRGLFAADAVRQILINQHESPTLTSALAQVPPSLADVQIQAADPQRYDHLLPEQRSVK